MTDKQTQEADTEPSPGALPRNGALVARFAVGKNSDAVLAGCMDGGRLLPATRM